MTIRGEEVRDKKVVEVWVILMARFIIFVVVGRRREGGSYRPRPRHVIEKQVFFKDSEVITAIHKIEELKFRGSDS